LDNNYYAGLYGEDPTWGAAIGYQESTLGKNRKYETPESFYSAWNYSRSPLLGNTVGGSIDKLRRILATVNNIYSIKSTGIPEEAYGRD
jgi:hypothetical protein